MSEHFSLVASEPIDLEGFREAVGGDENEMLDLMQLYLLELDKKILRLAEAMADGNGIEIKQAAHSLSGATFGCGLETFGAMLKEIEGCGIREEIEQARRIFAVANREANRIREALFQRLAADVPV